MTTDRCKPKWSTEVVVVSEQDHLVKIRFVYEATFQTQRHHCQSPLENATTIHNNNNNKKVQMLDNFIRTTSKKPSALVDLFTRLVVKSTVVPLLLCRTAHDDVSTTVIGAV